MCFPFSSARCRGVDDLADARDQTVEHEADDADIEQRQDDLADMRGIPRVPDEEADADAADQHFRGHDREPGQADADAKPREDVGRGGRDHDLGEELERIELHHRGDVAVVLRDVADADRGVDDDRPDRGDENDEDRGGLAVAERRERQRQPGQRRNRAQDLKQRIEPAHGPDRLADQDAERNAGDGGERIAERDALETGGEMPEQTLVDAAVVEERIEDQFLGVLEDFRRRRQRRAGAAADQLPHQHQQCDHDERRDHTHGGLPRHPRVGLAARRPLRCHRDDRRGGTRRGRGLNVHLRGRHVHRYLSGSRTMRPPHGSRRLHQTSTRLIASDFR
ncbi:hypothetical protein ACVWW7_006026 [Bradyrhizobium sp. LM6.9]